MKKTLRQWLGMCEHHWVKEEKYGVYRRKIWQTDERQVAILYVLRCEHCGAVKQTRVGV